MLIFVSYCQNEKFGKQEKASKKENRGVQNNPSGNLQQGQTQMQHKKEIITLSIFFFILLTASTSYDGIVAFMFEQLKMPDVGPASLAVLYLSFAVSLILAPAIRLPIKTQFLIAGATFPLNYILGLIASLCGCHSTIYWLVSMGTAISGIGNGIIWVSQGRYVHLVCEIFNESEDRGKMFALFGLFYCASLLAGSVVTLVGLGFFSVTVYFGVLVVVDIVGLAFCFFYLKDIDQIAEEEIARIEQASDFDKEVKVEKIQELVSKQSYRDDSERYDIIEFLRKFFRFIPYMLCMFPMFIIQAVCLGLKVNSLYKLIPDSTPDDLKTKDKAIQQMVSGVAAIVGMGSLGFIFDILGTLVAGKLFVVFYFLCCWIFIVAMQIQSLAMAFVVAFLWTFMLRYQFGLFPMVVSKHYQGRAEGFSVIKLIPALFNAGFQVVMIATKNKVSVQMIAGFSLLAIPAMILLSDVVTSYKPVDKNETQALQEEQP